MTLYYINPKTQKSEPVEISEDNQLEQFYSLLDCRCIDIPSFFIGGKEYDIICDDEFMFKEELFPSVVECAEGGVRPLIYGACLIANHDGEGKTAGLSADDRFRIWKSCDFLYNSDDSFPVVQAKFID